MKDIILVGAGGHCKSAIDVIEKNGEFKVVAIVDVQENVGKNILDYKISHTDIDLENLIKKHSNVIITLGQIKTPDLRIKLFEKCLKAGANFPVIISPLAYVSKHASIGIGTMVFHGAIVNASAQVGRNCIVNTKSLIEHDSQVDDHCHLSTCTVINGNITVGEGSFIGSNSVIKEGISIPPRSVISAGTFLKKAD